MTTLIIMKTLIYWTAGYIAVYMVLRPRSLLDALTTGPGMGSAGWEYHHKHYKLTYPVSAVMFVIFALVVLTVADTSG